jgi:glyoxylase-like metal-dependent hydrolase (beta-lactamase superfamily II)
VLERAAEAAGEIDVGRPDLLASIGFTRDELADQLYDSLHDKLMTLPDSTRVDPAHGDEKSALSWISRPNARSMTAIGVKSSPLNIAFNIDGENPLTIDTSLESASSGEPA